MLLLGYRNRDIAQMLGVNAKYIEKRKASATFKKMKSGERELQKIESEGRAQFVEIFHDITADFSDDDRERVYALIF